MEFVDYYIDEEYQSSKSTHTDFKCFRGDENKQMTSNDDEKKK
jgi:hypothetical protein